MYLDKTSKSTRNVAIKKSSKNKRDTFLVISLSALIIAFNVLRIAFSVLRKDLSVLNFSILKYKIIFSFWKLTDYFSSFKLSSKNLKRVNLFTNKTGENKNDKDNSVKKNVHVIFSILSIDRSIF